MRDRWDDASSFDGPFEECVYGSRLIGAEPYLTLHGGGNTSVKLPGVDSVGDPLDVLHVKGSGFDLATITPEGFVPLDLARAARLAELDSLADAAMMNALSCLRLDASAPSPSVETILHAVIPRRAVQHTHADAVLALTDTDEGESIARQVFGPHVLFLDYVMPGFPLAKACSELLTKELTPETVGIVLGRHGIFTFADDTRTAYKAMIQLVTAAEEHLTSRRGLRADSAPPPTDRTLLAGLRRDLSEAAGRPLVTRRCDDAAALRLARHPRRADIARRGPATPDHVIRTKRVPLVGLDVAGYAEEYKRSFAEEQARCDVPLVMLDPSPRVVLDPSVGVVVAGRTPRETAITVDIYAHTAAVIEDAEDVGGYRPIDAHDCFDMEYWELEQAKLVREGIPPPHAGEVALVTGAASGIGRAVATRLLAEGAAVVGLDLSEGVQQLATGPAYVGVPGDVRDPAALGRTLDTAARLFGGIDILVLAAGIFGGVERVEDISPSTWERTFSVNVDGVVRTMQAAYPLLRLSPRGGRVVVIGSKNVRAPGRGAGAYSASKAALNQVARVAALEWADDGIRVNSVHPDGVFDTGLWSDELVAERAASYEMSVEDYKARNLLKTSVTSDDVAAVVTALCGPGFSKVTGAHVPVDGGNERVI